MTKVRLEMAYRTIANYEKQIADLKAKLANLTPAAADVVEERRRQVEAEGWTPEHDDEHYPGEMSLAAACYAKYGDWAAYRRIAPTDWPWHESWWKPSDSRRNLVKAGALILAEIERMDRNESTASESCASRRQCNPRKAGVR